MEADKPGKCRGKKKSLPEIIETDETSDSASGTDNPVSESKEEAGGISRRVVKGGEKSQGSDDSQGQGEETSKEQSEPDQQEGSSKGAIPKKKKKVKKKKFRPWTGNLPPANESSDDGEYRGLPLNNDNLSGEAQYVSNASQRNQPTQRPTFNNTPGSQRQTGTPFGFQESNPWKNRPPWMPKNYYSSENQQFRYRTWEENFPAMRTPANRSIRQGPRFVIPQAMQRAQLPIGRPTTCFDMGGSGDSSNRPTIPRPIELQMAEAAAIAAQMNLQHQPETLPRLCQAMQPLCPPLPIATQRYRKIVTDPPHVWRMILIFGADVCNRQIITQKLITTYGFVRISIKELIFHLSGTHDYDHPYIEIVADDPTEDTLPVPDLICSAILNVMTTSTEKNFIIDDLPLDKYYLFELTHSVAPFARIPFVIWLNCDVDTCLRRCFLLESPFFKNMHPMKLRRDIETFMELLDQFLTYYRDMRMVRDFDGKKEADELFADIKVMMDAAVLRGEFFKPNNKK